jgi:hypothetical protein
MTIKGADWDRRLARAIQLQDGRRLRTLREAAKFVVEQDGMRQVWLTASQALMIASFDQNAVEGATEAVEKAIETLSSEAPQPKQK